MTAVVVPDTPADDGAVSGGTAAPEACPSGLRRLIEPRDGLLLPVLLGLGLLVIVLLRNRQIFQVAIFEDGDPAANSLLVDEAKRFRLRVGNYSRVGFNHPGPGLLYVQAWGELLFRDLLRLVPAPYNGQLLGVVVLNCALFGVAVRIAQRHLRSLSATATFAAAIVVFLCLQPFFFPASTWMPAMYVLPFATFLVAATSLLAGGVRYLWAFVVTGGLLVHGHVSFLLFVGATTGVVAVVAVLRRRHDLRIAVARNARLLVVCAGLVALFVLPIVVDALADWPGELGRYVSYVRSRDGQANGLAESVDYVEQYWTTDTDGTRVLLAALAGAGLALASATQGRARRFLLAMPVTSALASVLLLAYAIRGIDLLSETYIGWFYFSVPMLTAAGAAAAAVLVAVHGRVVPFVLAAVLGTLVLWAALRPTLSSDYRGTPGQPAALRALVERAAGRTLVFDFDAPGWPPGVGLLETARRADVPACVADPAWGLVTSGRELCTPAELSAGLRVRVDGPGAGPSDALIRQPKMTVSLPDAGPPQ